MDDADDKHGSKLITATAISKQLHVTAATALCTLKLYAGHSGTRQLADDTAAARVVWR